MPAVPLWTDYRFETKVQVTNAADYPGGIRGRVDTATGGGYAVWLYPGQGKIKLLNPSVWHIDTGADGSARRGQRQHPERGAPHPRPRIRGGVGSR